MHGINTGHVTSAASLSRSNSSEGLDRKISGDDRKVSGDIKLESTSSVPVISGTADIQSSGKLTTDEALVGSRQVVGTSSADA